MTSNFKDYDYCHVWMDGFEKLKDSCVHDPKQVKSDLLPFEHGQDGTHYACTEKVEVYGGKVQCCKCTKHKCKDL